MPKAATREKELAKPPVARKSKLYHFAILGGAAIVLIVGAVWRSGQEPRSVESTEMKIIEALRREVSGVQSTLQRNELQAIQQTIAEVTKAAAPFVVAARPQRNPETAIGDMLVRGGGRVELKSNGPDLLPGLPGFIIDSKHVLTSAAIAMYDGPFEIVTSTAPHRADLVGVDDENYLALLVLPDAIELPVAPKLQNSSDFQAGDWLIREGRSPTGSESRALTLLESVHATQTGETVGLIADASTHADGTVLIDVAGRVAGIYLRPHDSDGFVVPIRRALEVASRLKANPTTASTGWIGVELQELTDELKEYFSTRNGALVSSVIPNSPAAEAGIRAMDLIETLGGEAVASSRQLMDVIMRSAAGTKFQFGVKRNSVLRSINVTVMQPPAGRAPASSDAELLFLTLDSSSGSMSTMISAIQPKSVAYRIGIQAGDIIRSVDGTELRNSAQFWRKQAGIAPAKLQLWRIQRGDRFFFVTVTQTVKPS